jgi:DNA-binding HxlR family transcriptional regulator
MVVSCYYFHSKVMQGAMKKQGISFPRRGATVRGSKTGRPIMVALDLLGRRGALRVIWELRLRPLNFRVLQEAAATNPALLNTRLKELRAARIIEHEAGGYRLTGRGRALLAALQPLLEWAEQLPP